MKCPNCNYIQANKKDYCGRCSFDLRPRKRELGLIVSDDEAPETQPQAVTATPVTGNAAEPKSASGLSETPPEQPEASLPAFQGFLGMIARLFRSPASKADTPPQELCEAAPLPMSDLAEMENAPLEPVALDATNTDDAERATAPLDGVTAVLVENAADVSSAELSTSAGQEFQAEAGEGQDNELGFSRLESLLKQFYPAVSLEHEDDDAPKPPRPTWNGEPEASQKADVGSELDADVSVVITREGREADSTDDGDDGLSWTDPEQTVASEVGEALLAVTDLEANFGSEDLKAAHEECREEVEDTSQKMRIDDAVGHDAPHVSPDELAFSLSPAPAKPAVMDLSYLDSSDSHGDIDSHLAAILGDGEHDILEVTSVKTKADKSSSAKSGGAGEEVELDFEIEFGDDSLSFDDDDADDEADDDETDYDGGYGLSESADMPEGAGFGGENDDLLSGLVEALETIESSTSFMPMSDTSESSVPVQAAVHAPRRSDKDCEAVAQTLRSVLGAKTVSPDEIRQLCHLVADAYGINWNSLEPEFQLSGTGEEDYGEDFSPVLQSLEEELDSQLGELLREGTSIYTSGPEEMVELSADDSLTPLMSDMAPGFDCEPSFEALILEDDVKKNLS